MKGMLAKTIQRGMSAVKRRGTRNSNRACARPLRLEGGRTRHFPRFDAMLAGLMSDERPLADAEYEKHALSMFRLEVT